MAFIAEGVCLHVAKSPQGSSSNGCCFTVITTWTNSYAPVFSHTPYLYKVGMLKVSEAEKYKNKTQKHVPKKKEQVARGGIT